MKNLKLLSSALVIALIGSQAAIAAKKTFVYCSEGSPSIFNAQLGTDGTTFNASSRSIYNRLVEFKYGETEVIPGLAESWTVSKDGLKFTFKLRPNVHFHTTKYFKPTRTFNADDVVFTFHRMLKKDHPYHKVNGGTYEYFKSMDMPAIVKDVVKIDSMTVQFVLNKPEAPFVANMAMDFASIISEEYGTQLLKKKTPQKLDWEPIGTGPFAFKRYKKDTLIRYEAHPKYYRGKSPLDRLVFAITPDASVRFQKLRTGECDLVTEPAPADLAKMRADKNIHVMEREGLNVGYLAMNVEKKPFDNPLVRRAVHYALNRDSYIDAIYLGQAVVAKNPLPPTIWSYNKNVKDYEYNPEKAKALLKKAGLANGFSTELWVLPVARPYNPNGKKMGELMQADLAKVGIKVKLVQYDWPTYLAKARKGEHVMLQLGWTGDNGDPDNFLNVLLGCAAVKGGSNYARWCDKEFEDYVEKGKVITDVKKRSALYAKAQKRFKKQAPWVTLAHSKVFRAMRKNVVGYKIDPFGGDIFYGVDKK